MDYIIRPGEPRDIETITQFNCAMAKETEDKQLDTDTVHQGVSAVFADASRGFYLLAEHDGRTIGQLMITYEWSDWRNGAFWWIQSVYVVAEYRRQGVYRKMYGYLLERCQKDPQICGIRLYVETNNEVAQRTYRQLGMEQAHYHMFEKDFVL